MTPGRPVTQRFPRGLTLVELLVVIGIIGVLIATLLPMLAKARQLAQRTVCLSNQREVHRSLQLYAHDNDDRVPIGYRQAKQFNAMIYSRSAGEYVLMGKLYPSGLMNDGTVYFCPSEDDPQFRFDTDDNPWPPGPLGQSLDGVDVAAAPAIAPADEPPNVYAGYATRPEVELPDDFADPPARLANFYLPKLTYFKDKAILADLSDTLPRVTRRHGDGVNVLYANGGAHWVPLSFFEEPLEASPAPTWPPDPQWDDEQDEIWDAFDRG